MKTVKTSVEVELPESSQGECDFCEYVKDLAYGNTECALFGELEYSNSRNGYIR